MPSKDQQKSGAERAAERQERLARALRANLSKRKVLARAKARRDDEGATADPADEER